MKITEKTFFNIWKDICNNYAEELLESWTKKSSSKYTNMILGKKKCDSIIKKILSELKNINKNFDIQMEYYNCDVVFYDKNNMLLAVPSIFTKSQTSLKSVWLKEISIHLEHENEIKNSWQEIIQIMNFPGKELNILITYPKNHYLGNNEEKEVLNGYKDIINNTEFRKKKLLIIFGYMEESKIIWRGFFYKKIQKKFKSIYTS